MKEFSEMPKGANGIFFEVSKGLDAKTALAMFAGNTGAMIAGHEGTVDSIDYEDVQGNVPVLAQDQVITVGGESYRLAKAGDKPKALTISFSTGRTMTVGLLLQGQDKTTIHFKGDAGATKSTDLKLEDLSSKLLGKKFKCVKNWRDATNTITRNNPDGSVGRSYPANCYEFVETTV
jgi:hypothetical protein